MLAEKGTALHGVILLGGQSVAIDIEAIREVVPRPATLLPFPATLPAVAGAIDLRGTLVPVLDPALLPGFPASAAMLTDVSPPGIVTILRHGGGMFGLLTHAILGVADLGGSGGPQGAPALRPITINPGSGVPVLVTASFRQGIWQGVVLNSGALAALPGLPHTPDSQQNHTATADSLPTLMFVAGQVAMAITARLIDATLPEAPIAPPPIDDPLWIGMLPYKGRDIALVDTLALAGFAPTARPVTKGAAIVLRYPAPEGGFDHVALLIASVHDIAALEPQALLPMTDQAIVASTMADALFEARGRIHMRLGEETLLTHPSLAALAALRQTGTQAQARSQQGSDSHRPWLVFTLGQAAMATALDDVEEIIRADVQTLPMPHGRRALRGLAIHRGASVPLVDLGERLGLGTDGPRAFILISRHGEKRQGFLVDSLRSVERATAQALRAADTQGGPSIPVATVRIDAVTTCEVVDLPGLIAA